MGHQGEDRGPSGEEVFCVDRRLHPVLALHLPGNVDLQGRVRRQRTRNCPQKVLLSIYTAFTHIFAFCFLVIVMMMMIDGAVRREHCAVLIYAACLDSTSERSAR